MMDEKTMRKEGGGDKERKKGTLAEGRTEARKQKEGRKLATGDGVLSCRCDEDDLAGGCRIGDAEDVPRVSVKVVVANDGAAEDTMDNGCGECALWWH